jgi:hypothetical protein
LALARNALRNAGFTKFALMRSNQDTAVFDYHLPLNPVPIRLQGLSPTLVLLMQSQTGLVASVADGEGWRAMPLSELGERVTHQATRDNPSAAPEDLNEAARICVRPDNAVPYDDVLSVIAGLRDYGFPRVGLYSQAVVAIGEENGK